MTPPLLTFGDGDGVRFDLAKLLTSRLLVQGTSGAGKSWLLRYLLEQTHGQVQQIVIDREGEFTTLRDRFPYLLVGPGGDIPADPRAAKLLPRKLLELRVSALIDLSELNLHQQRQFVAGFAGTMAHAPRALWTDCLVVIDEAHLFAPEKGQSEAATAIADLASLGRKRGYCQVLATTRLAKLSKDASAECLNKLIGRTASDDLKRALEELGSSVTDRTTLRSLEPGQFYAYGPAIAVDPVLVRSGAIRTNPPARGAARPPVPPAPKQIRAILGELADLPQQADEEAQTLTGLRAQVRELQQQLATKPVPAPPKVEMRTVERAVLREGDLLRLEALPERIDALLDKLQAAATTVREGAKLAADSRLEISGPRTLPPLANPRPARAPSAPSRPESPTETEGQVATGPEARVLDALAWLASIGVPEPTTAQLAAIAGYSPTSGGFNNLRGKLRTRGLVDYPTPGTVALTPAGRALASAPSIDRSLAGLHGRVMHKLTAPQQKLLQALLDVYPEPLTAIGLAERTGYSASSGGFNNLRGSLRTLGLIEYPQTGFVRAAGLLFPPGLS